MKRLTFIAVSLVFTMMVSCSTPKKENQKSKESVETQKENPTTAPERPQASAAASDPGEKLFKDKGCVVCHQLNAKLVGPSLKDISVAYSGNKAGLIAFLKDQGPAIVDPAQASVMHPQLAITKALPTDELDAIVNHILSAK